MTLDEYNENKDKDIFVYYELMGYVQKIPIKEIVNQMKKYESGNSKKIIINIEHYYLNEAEAQIDLYIKEFKKQTNIKSDLENKISEIDIKLNRMKESYKDAIKAFPEKLIFLN